MLSGEFAVLYGGAAVLLPVPRYLYVSESPEPTCQKIPKAAEMARQFPIPELHEYEKKAGLPHLLIDDHEFYGISDDGRLLKLGIGSSAAQVVGVIELRFARAGFELNLIREKITTYSIAAHYEAQGGLGSGADVAVCAYNQTIRYRISREHYQIEPVERFSESKRDIPLMLLWSGQSADTRRAVRQFQTWAKTQCSADKYLKPLPGTLLEDLIISANELAEVWTQQSKDVLFAALDNFHEKMLQCSQAAGINYVFPKFAEVNRWALDNGCRAKPTGAGGGDMILLIGDLPLWDSWKGRIFNL